jgi:hypothetical protein
MPACSDETYRSVSQWNRIIEIEVYVFTLSSQNYSLDEYVLFTRLVRNRGGICRKIQVVLGQKSFLLRLLLSSQTTCQ